MHARGLQRIAGAFWLWYREAKPGIGKFQTLTESLATEKLDALLLAEQWEAALLLAETHALDTDMIHRHAFRISASYEKI